MTRESIEQCLSAKSFGRTLHFFETIGSTNDEAKRLAAEGAPEGTVVVALEQTAGRGRQDRSWLSEPGKNLTFTIVLRPRIAPASLGVVSLYASAATAECVTSLAGKPAGCKWPNDVVLSGRKIAGILCESSISAAGVAFAVVGIGLNVNQEVFPAGLAARSTSVAIETGRTTDLSRALCSLLGTLEARYAPAGDGWPASVIGEWTKRNVVLGSRVEAVSGSGRIGGIARAVTGAGALVIETPGGAVEVSAGDVHLV
jgi:BirA family biotin operon repressor/biotin-[acetyl-CoA-carboxylase] ligase